MSDFTIRVWPDAHGSGDNAIEVKLPDQQIAVGTTCEPPEDYEESLEATALYYAIERIAELEAENARLRSSAQVAFLTPVSVKPDSPEAEELQVIYDELGEALNWRQENPDAE